MKHTVQSLTPDVLMKMFGDSKDWYSVLKNGKRVGSFKDLRDKVLKQQKMKDSKERKKMMDNLLQDDYIREAKMYFESELKGAKVFLNQTQPNIHINGCKCYIICGNTSKVRLSIVHATATFDEMQQLAGIKGLPSSSPRHILFSGLEYDEVKKLIELLCV